MYGSTKQRGMTLVEVLIAVGLLTLIFGGLMVAFHAMSKLIGSTKAQAGALSLANRELEYIRSLPYDSVGTLGGIPDGLIPQISTTTQNGIEYTQRVLVEYIDDPSDGEGVSDDNGILADYKMVKVQYSWELNGESKTISLLTHIIPRGIETTAGGGTLVVNVFDAEVQPVSGAAVHVYNDTGTTTIDTIRYTNTSGVAMFAGAPALANYEITVTNTGFSTDQTYSASSTNVSPTTPHVAVLESEVSTMNFQIDELSSLTVETYGLPTLDSFDDTFTDATYIAASSSVSLVSEAVILAGGVGSFSASGTVSSLPIDGASLDTWETLYVEGFMPSNTNIKVQLYDATASTTAAVLIPDADLPGNAVGFGIGSVPILSLDTAVYTSVVLKATLESSDTATSSILSGWGVTYIETQAPIASVPFSLQGSKTIGIDALAQPVYKFTNSYNTDGTGDVSISDLEWDVYTVTVTDPSYDVAEACADIPYALAPGVTETLKLTLAPATAHSLRVTVTDATGAYVPNATVQLSRTGYSDTQVTSSCGQVFFNSGLVTGVDHTLAISAFGYISQTISDIVIGGTQWLPILLSE